MVAAPAAPMNQQEWTGRLVSTDEAPAALRDYWRLADEMNEREGEALRGKYGPGVSYVPLQSIEVRRDLSPREGLDQETIDRYAETIEDLPPIVVQNDTLTAVDGWHRIAANAKAQRDVVLVQELPIPNSKLFTEAVVRNIRHGRPLTTQERVTCAERMMEEDPSLTKEEVCRLVGLGRATLWRHTQAQEPVDTSEDTPKAPTSKDWLPGIEKVTEFNAGELAEGISEEDLFSRATRTRAVLEWLTRYHKRLIERTKEAGVTAPKPAKAPKAPKTPDAE